MKRKQTSSNLFTPGPWKTIDTYVEASNGRLVANAVKLQGKSLVADQEQRTEALQNARLMAAAPEMLHHLERCLGAFESKDLDRIHLDELRAVIAKATELPETLTDKIHRDIENGEYKKILPHEQAEMDWEYHNPEPPK